MKTVPSSAPARLDMPPITFMTTRLSDWQPGVSARARRSGCNAPCSAPGHAGQRAGDDEHRDLEADHRHARAFREPLPLADGIRWRGRTPTSAGARRSRHRTRRRRARNSSRRGSTARTAYGGGTSKMPLEPPGEPRVLDDRHAHHLAHQEGDEHEILARQAQHDRPDHGGEAAASRGADQQADRPGQAELHHRDRRPIGAEAP